MGKKKAVVAVVNVPVNEAVDDLMMDLPLGIQRKIVGEDRFVMKYTPSGTEFLVVVYPR